MCENSQSVCVCPILHLSHLSCKAFVGYGLSSDVVRPVRDARVLILTLGSLYKQSDQAQSQVKTLNLHVKKNKNCNIYLYFLGSGKRFYVITHLIGRSTCRKILHYICIYWKGHTWLLKSKNGLIAWKIAPQMFVCLFVFEGKLKKNIKHKYIYITFSKVVLLSV